MIEAFRRFVVGGEASGDRGHGRSIRGRRSRPSVAVEMLEGRMLLTGGLSGIPIHLTPPVQFQPTPDARQLAANDLFATLDSVRGSAAVTPVEIAKVRQDVSIIFSSVVPSSSTVTTFLNDYRAATVGQTLNPSSVSTLQRDLSTMLGSANVSMTQFRQFFLTQTPTIGGKAGTVASDPSFNDVKMVMVATAP